MAEVQTRVEGLSEILRALDALPERLERTVVRAGLRDAIKTIAADLGSRVVAITRTGALAKSLRIRTRKKQGQPHVMLQLGDKVAFYAHMVERGTRPHEIRPAGARSLFFAGRARTLVNHPGAPGRFVVKAAYEAKAEESVEAFRRYVIARVGREWNALARKGLVG